MTQLQMDLASVAAQGRVRSLRDVAFGPRMTVCVMAPHPDDFDAIGLTLRHIAQQGHTLHVAVLTTGASGVEDGFGGAHGDEAKAALREQEQRDSCGFFGLPGDRLHFLRLWQHDGDEHASLDRLAAWMQVHASADIVFMPHGNDSNRTHRRTAQAVHAVAARLGIDAWAMLNQDAKTIDMQVHLAFEFDDDDAAWKSRLLRMHRSQQDRNLRTRGQGFDQRVLQVNAQAARALGLHAPYAEAFELQRLGRVAPTRRATD